MRARPMKMNSYARFYMAERHVEIQLLCTVYGGLRMDIIEKIRRINSYAQFHVS